MCSAAAGVVCMVESGVEVVWRWRFFYLEWERRPVRHHFGKRGLPAFQKDISKAVGGFWGETRMPEKEACQGKKDIKEGRMPRKEGYQGRKDIKEGRTSRKGRC